MDQAGTTLPAVALFARAHKTAILALSALAIVPCWWHRHIEAGDLGSHVYNAWLAQLIGRGQAPGLYISLQWSNVLFDLLLLKLSNLFGFLLAEKIAVSICVLVFFWGTFSFVSAVSGRRPWLLAPALLMLSYGYCFHMGFFNYYLSIGLAGFGLALLWNGGAWDWLAAALVAFLALLAHPLGFVWMLSAAAYRAARKYLHGWRVLIAPAVALTLLIAVHFYLSRSPKFIVDWSTHPLYGRNGTDQLAIFGRSYAWLARTTFFVSVFFMLRELLWVRTAPEKKKALALPLELYALMICAAALLPENLMTPLYAGWAGLIVSRLTLITAIIGLCLLSAVCTQKWQLAAFGTLALVFFGLLYRDTRWLNQMESNAENVLRRVPYGTRVIPKIAAPGKWRAAFVGHLADRACIARCFTYSNYEPSSGQFRVRVSSAGSPIATVSADDAEDMEGGGYEVQDSDPPLKELYQCDPRDLRKLCLRDLAEGDVTGTAGPLPPHPAN